MATSTCHRTSKLWYHFLKTLRSLCTTVHGQMMVWFLIVVVLRLLRSFLLCAFVAVWSLMRTSFASGQSREQRTLARRILHQAPMVQLLVARSTVCTTGTSSFCPPPHSLALKTLGSSLA
eukprot:Rmarinus@m.9679